MKQSIYLTGFSEFKGCKINPTSKIINLLKEDTEFIKDNNIKSLEILKVSISKVEDYFIKNKDNNTNLFIHLGVAGSRFQFDIEELSFNEANFKNADVDGNTPKNEPIFKNDKITSFNKTNINVDKLINYLNLNYEIPKRIQRILNKKMTNKNGEIVSSKIENNTNNKIIFKSKDAGRFLCNYIYHKSLNFTNNNSLFIHVPNEMIISIKDQLKFIKLVINYFNKEC